jgi:hypothetical protein
VNHLPLTRRVSLKLALNTPGSSNLGGEATRRTVPTSFKLCTHARVPPLPRSVYHRPMGFSPAHLLILSIVILLALVPRLWPAAFTIDWRKSSRNTTFEILGHEVAAECNGPSALQSNADRHVHSRHPNGLSQATQWPPSVAAGFSPPSRCDQTFQAAQRRRDLYAMYKSGCRHGSCQRSSGFCCRRNSMADFILALGSNRRRTF